MMDLREPKKKKRVRLQAQPSLPISIGDDGKWRVYTAHLSALGTCIVDPGEMEAVYSMGFFGKGSLSKSFPSFGRKYSEVPPIIRNRQWLRRQQWLKELESLNEDTNPVNLNIAVENGADDDLERESMENDSCQKGQESISEISDDLKKTTNSVISLTELNASTSCNEKAVEFDTKPQEDPTDATELEVYKNITTEPATNEISPKLGSKTSEQPEESTEKEKNFDSSVEIVEDEKIKKCDSSLLERSKEPTEQKNPNDCCVKITEDEKSQESGSKISPSVRKDAGNKIEENSAIECIEEESCVKRAKIDNNEKGNDKSMKVDEVLLDSTEDEEMCEIVEKEHNDESFFLNDEISIEKSTDCFMDDGEESIVEEETNPYELLVLPDTDSDTENYLKNVESRVERDGFPVNETLHLTFEETFFLMYGLGCLQLIHYDGSIFSINNAWNYFQQQDKYFIQKYVVYHYFRSKGWIVKPGMKFGGDFLLYKQGPPFYHASYIVVIEVMDADTLIRDDMKSLRKMTWKNLIGLERLSETIAKEILFAQILWPSSIVRNGNTMTIDTLSEFTVRELLWRRWNPKRKQEITLIDEEDSDSM